MWKGEWKGWVALLLWPLLGAVVIFIVITLCVR